MSGHREYIKNLLGITEYPWSSDEEAEEMPSLPSLAPNLQSTQPSGTAVRNLPETPVSQESSPGINLNRPGNARPNTSISVNIVNDTPGSNTRPNQATKFERNLFWSMLCSPIRGQMDPASRSSNADAPRRDSGRSSTTPNASTEPMRGLQLREISGILALKRRRLHHHHSNPGPGGPSTSRGGSGNPSSSRVGVHSTTSASRHAQNPRAVPMQLRDPRRTWIYPRSRSHHTTTVRPTPPGSQPQASFPFVTLVDGQDENVPVPPTPPQQPPQLPTAVASDDDVDMMMMEEPGGGETRTDGANDFDDIQVCEPANAPAAIATSTPVAIATSTPAEMSLEEVVEVEPSAETVETQATPANATDDAQIVSVVAPAAEIQAQESRAARRRREALEDSREYTAQELNQCLLRLLECPVCLDWMEPPMSQCRRGHLICDKCRGRLTWCPVCRTAFSTIRNRAMEQVSEILRYPCRHGCGREVRHKRRSTHEANCALRKYPCPVCANRAPMDMALLVAHSQIKHQNILMNGVNHQITVKMDEQQLENRFILAFGALFHCCVEVLLVESNVYLHVTYIGPTNQAKNYIYEISIKGKNYGRRMTYSRTTHNDLESRTVKHQDCFVFSFTQLVNFLKTKVRSESESTATFNLEIRKSSIENGDETVSQ